MWLFYRVQQRYDQQILQKKWYFAVEIWSRLFRIFDYFQTISKIDYFILYK